MLYWTFQSTTLAPERILPCPPIAGQSGLSEKASRHTQLRTEAPAYDVVEANDRDRVDEIARGRGSTS